MPSSTPSTRTYLLLSRRGALPVVSCPSHPDKGPHLANSPSSDLPHSVKTRIQAGQGNAVAEPAKVKDPKDPSKKIVTVPKHAGLFKGILTIARSEEGPLGLYKGFGASMVNTFSTRQYSHAYTSLKTPRWYRCTGE